jgi:hypothetical protein
VDSRQLDQRAQQVLRELGLPFPLDVELLRIRLADWLGKEILFSPMVGLIGRGAFGFLWNDPADNVIVIGFEEVDCGTHQTQLHEMAHLILRHPGHNHCASFVHGFQRLTPQAVAAALGHRPSRRWLLPRSRRRADIGYSLYDEEPEREAETMATIMHSWVRGCGGHLPPSPRTPLAAILGDRTPW